MRCPVDHGSQGHHGGGFWVRAVGQLTLTPHTMGQVSVTVSARNAKGTVMVEAQLGPMGLCPVQGVAKLNQGEPRHWSDWGPSGHDPQPRPSGTKIVLAGDDDNVLV